MRMAWRGVHIGVYLFVCTFLRVLFCGYPFSCTFLCARGSANVGGVYAVQSLKNKD